VARQCELVGLPRSSFYYRPDPGGESAENLRVMRQIDRIYMKWPFYGSPRITWELRDRGWEVNEKRVARLMRRMGLQALVPGPHTSVPHPKHPVYPYLLRNLEVIQADQVWCSDVTYIPMNRGFQYLVVVMDWYSRYVLSWELSNSLEAGFCVTALEKALRRGSPGIFNTDQGAQFTSEAFTQKLRSAGIRISMDGKGRALDNIFVERLWRTVKYEEVYPGDYADGAVARHRLGRYFPFYNDRRRHQALGRRTPAEVYLAQN
jgi:putative transposase